MSNNIAHPESLARQRWLSGSLTSVLPRTQPQGTGVGVGSVPFGASYRIEFASLSCALLSLPS